MGYIEIDNYISKLSSKYFDDMRRFFAKCREERLPEDIYSDMAIEKPHKRNKADLDGKKLGKRATRKLIRELREEFSDD